MSNPPPPIPYDMLAIGDMLDHITRSLRHALDDDGKRLPIFRMENHIVRIYRWEQASSDYLENLRRDDDALVVDPVDVTKMHEYIIEHAPFVKMTGQGPQAMAAPEKLAKHYMAAQERWRFRVLTGVIAAPTIREDGSLLLDDGWDKASGLYLDKGGVGFPAIPNVPTRADALTALAVLKTPFEEFPFEETEDFPPQSPSLSVALAAILTGLIRRTLPTAPIFGFDAPEAGSGKGLACNVVSIIVTGNRATAINFSTTDTEFRKLLFAALLKNDPIITLDNISRPLEGDALNTLMTEATMSDRRLGFSENPTVPTNVLVLANGNNLLTKGDTHRRLVAARILTGEHPERRKFKRPNLLQYVEANRPALVSAGLTILRAYHCAGYPGGDALPEFGSYETWSKRVRAALVWLDLADPVQTQERFTAADPEREALGAMLRALYQLQESKWFKAKDISLAMDDALLDALALADVTQETKAIGQYLAGKEGKTVDGLRLTGGTDTHTKVRTFRVTAVNP